MKPTTNNIKFILQAAFASFGAYFCMYAFRKPFTVATFENLSYWGVDYKILLIIAQVLGYTLSKFIGIKVISEMKSSKRIYYLIGFILVAELALLGFAIVPAPYNILFLFLNGLPLGMIWGIVFSYIEGRKASEILGVILCSSFIVSSGIVKSVGKYVLDTLNVSELWMPFITGLFFIIPLIVFAFLLERIPPPNKDDISLKLERKPLDKHERAKLFKNYALPLTFIIIFYTLLTAVRDFRDNFARELWDALGFKDSAAIYSLSELPIAITVLIILAIIGSISNNKKAFKYYHVTLLVGCILVLLTTLGFQVGIVNPVVWMIVSGFGMYICYVPFNGLYFDRMISTLKINGNVGFLIYIADSFGYLGSVIILLYKNFGYKSLSWLGFFIYLLYILAFLGIIATGVAFTFFRKKQNALNTTQLNYEF